MASVLSDPAPAPRSPRNWAARLQHFIATPIERCDLCGQAVPELHDHLLDIDRYEAVCACIGCATVLGSKTDGNFRAMPPRADPLPDFRMTDAEWGALDIPIGMAFLVKSSRAGRPVAYYPGPGGATETTLHDESWATIVANNPDLSDMPEDVEALLVNRIKGRRDCYRVSVDRCFVLVALFRKHWRGFTGGDPVWKAVGDFFETLEDTRPARKGWAHG